MKSHINLYIQSLFPLYFLIFSLFPPMFLDKQYMALILVGVLIMLLNYFYACHKTFGTPRIVSICNIFILFYIIVYFQFAADYVLGFDVNTSWIYRADVFGGALAFSALCLSVILLGYLIPKETICKKCPQKLSFSHIGSFVILSWLCFCLFVKVMGFSFFIGGYGAAGDGSTIEDPSGARYFNYMQLFLKCTLVMIVWNAYNKNKKNDTLSSYIKLFPISFTILYFAVIILWFSAGGRAVSVTLFFFWICGYFILSKKDVPWILVLILVVIGGFLFSIFKIAGGLSFSAFEGLSIGEAISRAYNYYINYNSNTTFFSPTRELSFSVYTYNIFYHIWYSGQIYGGIFVLLSLVGGIPGLTPLASYILNIDLNYYFLAKIITEYDNSQRGLGSACVGELLCDVGPIITIAIFFFIGILFRKLDLAFQKGGNNLSLFLFIMAFCYFSTVFFIPRGSLLSGISNSLFIYILLVIYAIVSKLSIARK